MENFSNSSEFQIVVNNKKRKTEEGTTNSATKKPLPEYSIPVGSRFEPLNNARVVEPVDKAKTPPIIVDCKMEEVETLLAKCASSIGSGNFTAKILNRTGRVRLNAINREQHQRLKQYLGRQAHQFHSFTPESEREFTAVILGLYQVEAETVKLNITNAGVAVKSVTNRKTKSNLPLFVARFAKGTTNIKELQQKCGLLCNCVVTWQPFSPAVKEYTQCFNCQQYGHAASNCNRTMRCVKCLEFHDKGSCKRTTTEGTAKCVNCNGDHAANYKGCSAYQRYKSARVKQREETVVTPKTIYVPAPAPPVNFWKINAAAPKPINKPPEKPPAATPQQPEQTPGNIFAELKAQVEELQQIPNIKEIVEELKKLIMIIKSSKSTQEAAMNIAMSYMSSP